jgi:multidrug resistance efflux pump
MIDSAATVDVPLVGGRRLRLPLGRALRIALGLAILVTAAAIYGPDLIYTSSSEAVINARVIDVAAPIGGRIVQAPPAEGTVINAGTPLLVIDNPLVDRSRLIELEAAQTRVTAELVVQKRLVDELTNQISSLDQQMKDYLTATVTRLALALEEAEADATAAEASAVDAGHNYERKHALQAGTTVSLADIDQAQHAALRTKALADAARSTAKRVAAELDAAKHGVLVAADRNDVPYSEQRMDEFRERKAEAEVQVATLDARLGELNQEVTAERLRDARVTGADIKAPANGVVWRPLVAQGSAVAQDAPLLTLIDCSELYTTAVFSGRQFDDLYPGRTAVIHVSGTDQDYAATLIDARAVSGTDAQEHFAAPLPKLGDRQILAVLRLDNAETLAKQKYCGVGRRVEVRFTDKAASAINPVRP